MYFPPPFFNEHSVANIYFAHIMSRTWESFSKALRAQVKAQVSIAGLKRKVHPNLIATSTVSFKQEIEEIWPSGHRDPVLINPYGPGTEQRLTRLINMRRLIKANQKSKTHTIIYYFKYLIITEKCNKMYNRISPILGYYR